MAHSTPKGFRLHIGIFGRRNVGKSSLLNAVTRQQVSIVSEHAGTTTDPVEKPMELLPLGPVLFIDTAGLDDVGDLGRLRIDKTKQIFDRTDLGVLVIESGHWSDYEEKVLAEFVGRKIPTVAVFNKIDKAEPNTNILRNLTEKKIRIVETDAISGKGILDFRRAILDAAPDDYLNTPPIVGDIVGPGEMAVLVVPIDKEAPKGRLILPQVQTIRDLLDNDAFCAVVKERELREILERLKTPPKLVVTDSQAFLKVAADTPPDVMMTGFSILYARFRGDLISMVQGAMAVDKLKKNDRILIAESCAHHPIADDIGRVKIPRWLEQYVGGKLHFTHVQGHDFPDDLDTYKLIIHCGACVTNRREVLSRIIRCREAQVPITNYGLVIAFSLGIFDRALEPFPAALEVYQSGKS